MAEKIIETLDQITITRTNHEFYCDGCGEFMYSVEEYDDGYLPDTYHEVGTFGARVHFDNHDWVMNEMYCDKCKPKQLKRLTDGLRNLGFHPNGYDL